MKIFCGIFCAVLSFGASVAAENLQDMLDFAAQTPEKILRLQGKTYVIEKPLRLDNRHSGLTVIGDPSGRTAISSGAEILDWRGSGGGIFEADVPEAEEASSLFVNSRRAQLAETPNGGFFFVKRKVPSFGRGGSSEEFAADKKDVLPLLPLSAEELKNARIDVYMSWIHVWLKPEKLEQQGMDEESVLVKFLPPASCRPFFIYDKNPRYKILNIRPALDLGGEFCFDKSKRKIFYKPREFEDMKAARAVYPRLETLLFGAGKSAAEKMRDVKFQNIAFECGGVKALENGAWRTSAQGATSFPALVSFKNASGIVFEGCIFRHSGGYAIEFAESVWDSKIENCQMCDLGAGGVRLGVPKKAAPSETPELDGLTSGRIKVSNNIIFCYGRECKSGVGILAFDVSSCEISHNEILDGYYTGISVGWTWGSAPTHTQNNRINFNRISNLSFGVMSDLGGIYTLGSSEGSEIIGNVISDITCHNYGGWGIYNDEGSSGFSVRKNFVKNAQEGGYFMHYGSNCTVENNLFVGSRDFQTGLGRHRENSFVFRKNMLFFPPNSPVLRGEAIAPKNAKFERNAYWGGGAKLDFAGMDFEAWRKSGQDIGSVEEYFDFEKIAKGAEQNKGSAAEKIGFEKLDVLRAGAQGKMRAIADEILKSHKFPAVLRTAKESDFEQYVFDDFSREKINEKPVLNVEFVGEKGRVVNDEKFGKVLEVADEKCEPSWMPYFYYRCKFKFSQHVKISFKMKLEAGSRFLFELRENEGVLGRGAKFEIRNLSFVPLNAKLPENMWLDVEMFAFVNGGNPCAVENLRICGGGKELVKTSIPARENFSQTFGWVGFIFTGDSGAKTKFADFKIEKCGGQ
ncbi:MAG: right-handed parallel beta-helix repeat-containing protein [Opitutales bacterium]|nr:right-handed parallel beta-helix repeat-containing protein [Opitutales bacterium]